MSGRKVWVRCGMVLAIALVLLCSSALAALKYPFYTVTTDSVRLRKSASLKAVVVENLEKGTTILVTGKSGNFYKVEVEGTPGYIQKDFVSTDSASMYTPTPVPEATQETVTGYPYETVTTAGVNLRETKSTSAAIVAKIPSGADIVVRSVSGTWAEIEYQAYLGYVKKSYVALKKVADPTPTPTPVITLSPEESAGSYIVLSKGSEGADVKALQQALLELGFLNGEADGKFGSATENALILFEQANDYPISVEADANLQAFLFCGKPKNAEGVATKVTVVSAVAGASMQLGNTGDAVVKLQSRLSSLGYYTGAASGTYDKETKKAVAAFQKKNGLTSDGIAGKATQDVLYSSAAMAANETPTPSPSPTPTAVPSFTIPSGKVERGTEGENAKLVQQRLKDLGYYRGRVDGKFGTQSVRSLKSFQEAHGLEADGVAGEDTYKVLFSWGALAYGTTATPAPAATATPTPAPTVTPTPEATATLLLETLRKGDSGEAVRLMQEALINLGYLSGTADGIYGNSTVSAVKSFQKTNGLKVDGVAGNATLSLLYSSSAKAAPVTVTPTPSPTPTATPAPASSSTLLKKGSTGDAVKELQERLIALGYLQGKADGIFGTATYKALVAFQKASKLSTDGIAGSATLSALSKTSAKATSTATAAATATPAPTKSASSTTTPSAKNVIYANWYKTVKAICKKYPYATVYDYKTGISWQIHIFSLGAHADYEPVSANDTAKMLKVFGSNTWNPRAVWVIFADGSVYLGSTHSMPHGTQHNTGNNFDGHSCLHFPRTQEQVESIGTYATSHQTCIDKGWAETQAMIK